MMTLTAACLVMCLSWWAALGLIFMVGAVAGIVLDPDPDMHTAVRLIASAIVIGLSSLPAVMWFTFVFRMVPLMGVW
jgi:hypothetical protein